MKTIQLLPGRDKSILRKHPWIFSGAIKNILGNPISGETVKVISSKGEFLAWASYSPTSQIALRIWSFNEEAVINELFLSDLIKKAINRRVNSNYWNRTNSCRLIHGESDFFPGLIVDKYSDHLVIQILSAGAEFWKKSIVEILANFLNPKSIHERSDVEVRKLEGLEQKVGNLYGVEPTNLVEIFENQLRFLVDIKGGQKTGFYLDQRENRSKIIEFAENKKVLNCFSYSGGFTVNYLHAKAKHVLSIDSSGEALELSKKNIVLNNFSLSDCDFWIEDVFIALRKLRDMGDKFELIILDPPKFAPTASQAQKASRAYKDINLLALKLLEHGGLLFTFSCSGGINEDLFKKIIASAASDAQVNAQILGYMSQGSDHPVSLSFPEGEYLKGLIIKKI